MAAPQVRIPSHYEDLKIEAALEGRSIEKQLERILKERYEIKEQLPFISFECGVGEHEKCTLNCDCKHHSN